MRGNEWRTDGSDNYITTIATAPEVPINNTLTWANSRDAKAGYVAFVSAHGKGVSAAGRQYHITSQLEI